MNYLKITTAMKSKKVNYKHLINYNLFLNTEINILVIKFEVKEVVNKFFVYMNVHNRNKKKFISFV